MMKWKILTKNPLGQETIEADYFCVEDGTLIFYKRGVTGVEALTAYAPGCWTNVWEAPE